MSEETSPLPPQLQEQLQHLQQLQQTLQLVVSNRQQLELELSEIGRASSELEKMTDDAVIYKSIGTLLVRSNRSKVIEELKERKSLLDTRVEVLARQQSRSEGRIKELQKSIQERIKQLSPS